jgi:predicted ABC-type ATPase
VNADLVAREMRIDSYAAKGLVDQIRRELFQQKESFIFETVFSDPVGEKLNYFKAVEKSGYTVVLIFIGLRGSQLSSERVAMRVMKGGHDVPEQKIVERYQRVMGNLKKALNELTNVLVYDNSDLNEPYRLVAVRTEGAIVQMHGRTPNWLSKLLR